jgi:hypothetical protein
MDTYATLVNILTEHLRQTRKAYYASMPGVTYDDMRAAAVRVLEARANYERASGRKVTSKPTAGQVSTLLRINL